MPDFTTLQALSQGSLIAIIAFQYMLYQSNRTILESIAAIRERLSNLEGQISRLNHE